MRLRLLVLSFVLAFLLLPHKTTGDQTPTGSKWTAVKRWNIWTKVTYDHTFNQTNECGGSTHTTEHETTETTGTLEFFEHNYEESPEGVDIVSWYSDSGRASGSKSVKEESIDCEGKRISMTINGSGPDTGGTYVGLRIDQKKGQYDLNAHTGANYTIFRHIVTPSGTSDDHWEYGHGHDYPIDEVPLPGGASTVLSGTHVFDTPPYAGNGTRIFLEWRLTPADREELEVVVEPDRYEEWLPEGGEDEDSIGNGMFVFARLQAKDGSTPQQKAVRFIFELIDTSRNPGVCGNRPQAADVDYDMRFDKEINRNLEVTGTWLQTAQTKKGEYTDAGATICSYDYGGYCQLKVRAVLTDGSEVVGHLKGDTSQTDIRVPKRAADSKIADAWKKKEAVQSLGDGDDSDETPKLDGHNGDGLSLYEEYRGFRENGEFFRAKPKRKELFIVDKVGNRTKDGIALLRAATGLLIYDRLLPNEADEEGVVNSNHAGVPRVGNKWAVRIEYLPGKIGYAYAEGETGGPKKVVMTDDYDPGPGGWNKSWGKRIITDEYASTVAHEILHTLSVDHHGETDLKERMWMRAVGDLGLMEIKEYNVTKGVAYGPGQVIRVMTEDGRELGANSRSINLPQETYVAARGGQHSGHEDCLMRYSCADAYVSPTDSSVRYLVTDEMTGLGLCRDPRGTGVNDPGRKPRPRHGNAGSGNCYEQPCVNDAAH